MGESDPVIMTRALNLRSLHMEAGPLITDDLVRRLLAEGHFCHLGEADAFQRFKNIFNDFKRNLLSMDLVT